MSNQISKGKSLTPNFCYAIILEKNVKAGEIFPAFIVCWNRRANNDSYVFSLCRSSKILNPVLTSTPLDIYELAKLYEHYRFSIRIKGKPRKVPIKGILVALRCNDDCTQFRLPAYYISDVNRTPGCPNNCLDRWRSAYLDKEKEANRQYGMNEILSYEDGIKID